MTEQVSVNAIEEKAKKIVFDLKEASSKHEHAFPSQIEAVLVFSGPGTYYEPLKPGQPEWMRWMDRDRLRAGTAVVREVTASRKAENLGLTDKGRGSKMSLDDVRMFGPLLVYNGVPIDDPEFRHENISARRAFASEYSKLPEDRVIIIDELKDENGQTRPLHHTGDQTESLFQELADSKSPLAEIRNVALVSHLAHFIRIPFYLKNMKMNLFRTVAIG